MIYVFQNNMQNMQNNIQNNMHKMQLDSENNMSDMHNRQKKGYAKYAK